MRVFLLALFSTLATTPGATLLAQAGHDAHSMHHPADTSFRAMQARGKTAMGVDQERSTHHFISLPDGGLIQLQSDTEDSVATAAIRAHFAEIERAFASGDFTTPVFVHDNPQVPGTKVMKAAAGAITFVKRELPRGAELRITTKDPEALAAIHQFLAFQRTEHHSQ
jgi:hypothetical protein